MASRVSARHAFLFLAPVLLWAAAEGPPKPATCDGDSSVPTDAAHAALWSALGGRISFPHGDDIVRLTFRADPDYLRFDQDASLRVRTAPACGPSDRLLALDFEVRFSSTLRSGAELADVMLLGKENRMLTGAGVAAPDTWTPVRVVVPPDAKPFNAVHFGAGAAWARERPGEEVRMDVRRVTVRRAGWSHSVAAAARQTHDEVRRDPDDPQRPDPRAQLVLAPGAPAWAVVDLPGTLTGSLQVDAGALEVKLWQADWMPMEVKPGVVRPEAIRLLRFTGRFVPRRSDDLPHRFWLRFAASEKTKAGLQTVKLRMASAAVTYAVEVVSLPVPPAHVAFVMYYQMNRSWPAWKAHAAFFEDAPAHFAQLAELGFTGIQLAEDPVFNFDGERIQANFTAAGRYWQNWPASPAVMAKGAFQAGLTAPVVWEGLRVFGRDDVWARLAPKCGVMPDAGDARFATLATAVSQDWQDAIGGLPLFAIADEPGVASAEAVEKAGKGLRVLREAGFRTYLTTHARLFDSFHQLAPWLDVNALHAEDVTAGAAAFVRARGGQLWLYNGGSFNTAPPRNDRFFTGVYGWVAGADGVAQWIYSRPSALADALDLRTHLRDDAQFYALPGPKDEPAPTPGLLGLAAGITDRGIIEAAAKTPRGQAVLARLRAQLPLPHQPSEYTPARLEGRVDLHAIRAELLRSLISRSTPAARARRSPGSSQSRIRPGPP